MGGIAAFLSAVLAEWLGAALKKWAFKVGLAATMLGAYTACYLAFLAGLTAVTAYIIGKPSIPIDWWNFLAQFFPSRQAIATACTAYWGSMAVKKACGYWVKASQSMAVIVK